MAEKRPEIENVARSSGLKHFVWLKFSGIHKTLCWDFTRFKCPIWSGVADKLKILEFSNKTKSS